MAGYSPLVVVTSPSRGAGNVLAQFRPKECVLTWSLGLQPATGLIDWVSAQTQPTIPALANMAIYLGTRSFYGYAEKVVPVEDSDGGRTMMMEFVDNRGFLMWDKVYCAFNIRETRIVNGIYTRYYKHLLPNNYWRNIWTYTPAPMWASYILQHIFASTTIESPWTRVYHGALNTPIYELDFRGGVFLGAAIQEISERCGTTFTLINGAYNLQWFLKGEGVLPDYGATGVFPPTSNNRRIGTALSGNPTRVTVVGGRNRYQVLGITLQPDWLNAWQQFYDFGKFVKDIYDYGWTEAGIGTIGAGVRYNAIPGDTDHVTGFQLAAARARTITVAEYAAMRDIRSGDGNYFRDYRLFQKQSRLQMPAAVYLNQILFRAFRIPSTFFLRNWLGELLPADCLQITDRAVCEVSHNPSNGQMFYDATMASEHNGYAIAQGYQVGADAFKGIDPERVDLAAWQNSQYVWQGISFSIDNSGEGSGSPFIIFAEPMIRSADLIDSVTIDGILQDYPAMNANATVTAPVVRAALTFEAEPFTWTEGIAGMRDDSESVSALHGEFIAFANYALPVEIPFADNYYAWEKASQIIAPLLNRQFEYNYGGYRIPGSSAITAGSLFNRITIRLSPDGGLAEDIDFTTERSRNMSLSPSGRTVLHPESERNFERYAQTERLFPRERELRDEANQMQAIAAYLRANPRAARNVIDTFHYHIGFDTPPAVVLLSGAFSGNLPVGTPLFQNGPTAKWPTAPNDSTPSSTTSPVFTGVTTMNNEDPTGPVRVSRTGNNGVIFARVKGPVKFGEAVGPAKGDSGAEFRTYLVGGPHTAIGNVLASWTGSEIKFVRVQLTGGGAGGEIRLLKLKSIERDLLVCHEWDGADEEGDIDIYVAKPYELRNSITTEVLNGTTYTYDYEEDTVTRTATSGGVSVAQEVTMPYIIDGPVWAFKPNHTMVFNEDGELTYQDSNNDARAWACIT